jgi:hypothetical protein
MAETKELVVCTEEPGLRHQNVIVSFFLSFYLYYKQRRQLNTFLTQIEPPIPHTGHTRKVA